VVFPAPEGAEKMMLFPVIFPFSIVSKFSILLNLFVVVALSLSLSH
jgi:hypothetical protein